MTRRAVAFAALALVPLCFVLRAEGTRAEQQRLRTVLIVDVSASVDAVISTGPAPLDALAAIDQWLSAPDPIAGEWQFGRVNRQPQLGGGFSSDRDALRASARTLFRVNDDERFGPSPVWDAIELGIESLSRQAEPARGSIVVVTDGRVSGNRAGVADVIAHARAARVAVHVIDLLRDQVFEFDRRTALLVQPKLALEDLAKGTGGRYVPRDDAPLAAHLRQLITSPAR